MNSKPEYAAAKKDLKKAMVPGKKLRTKKRPPLSGKAPKAPFRGGKV